MGNACFYLDHRDVNITNAVRTDGQLSCRAVKTTESETYLGTAREIRLTSFPTGHYLDFYY